MTELSTRYNDYYVPEEGEIWVERPDKGRREGLSIPSIPQVRMCELLPDVSMIFILVPFTRIVAVRCKSVVRLAAILDAPAALETGPAIQVCTLTKPAPWQSDAAPRS